MKISKSITLIAVKWLDRIVNPDFRKRIILTLLSCILTIVGAGLFNFNLSKLYVKHENFSLDIVLSDTNSYLILAVAVLFLLAALYQTSFLIKEATLKTIKKNEYDESKVEELDGVISLSRFESLMHHIISNLSVLESDLDYIPDLTELINLTDSVFQNSDIEFLRKKSAKSIADLNDFISNNFHTFRADNSIMLMPHLRRTPDYAKWKNELQNLIKKATIDYKDFRKYCSEKLIK